MKPALTSQLVIAGGLLLAACSGAEGGTALPDGAELIGCALSGEASFAEDCYVERAEVDGQLQLVVRHPDGGFRRFDVLTDGRGLAVADGAEIARIDLADSLLTVTVGRDRYVFPATVKDDGTAQ